MHLFGDIVGHEQIIAHLQKAIRDQEAFHAYIFQGELGTGKKMMARTFAAGMQCTGEGEKPCGKCVSCKQQESENHPDIIWIRREKPSLGVDEIREQLVNTMDIKPFSSKYKIYIISEAEKMTEAAQNALLKTIEEPPEYGVVILLTNNLNQLLPTIRSRCLNMEFRPLTTSTIEQYLIDKCDVPDYLAKASAVFAQGNLGKAIRYAKSSDFMKKKEVIFDLLRSVPDMTVHEMLEVIRVIGENRDEVNDYLDLMVLWYRDVLLYKATRDLNQLLFREDYKDIQRASELNGYLKLEHVMEAFDKAKVRLKANVNFDLSMELLLLTLKDNG